MDPYAQKVEVDLQERISVLPEDITELYTLGIVDSVIEETKETYDLSVTQARMLNVDIDLVLLLFYPRLGFSERIKESMELLDEKAESIANHIDAEIFATVGYVLDILDEDAAIVGNTDVAPADISSETPETETKNEPVSPPKPSRPGLEPITPSDMQPRGNQFNAEPVDPPALHEVKTNNVPDTESRNPLTQSTSSTAPEPTPAAQVSPPQAPTDSVTSPVQPIKTMEHDLDKIHGYGSYKKLNPHTGDEPIQKATSQDEVLNGSSDSVTPPQDEDTPPPQK